MRRSPVLAVAFLGFALGVAALGPSCDASKCCALPPSATDPGNRPCDSNLFTACVHSCGETNSSEPTAATCANGVYTCNESIPAVACASSGWSSALPCGPWVDGHDCGSQCAICDQGLWSCGACGDAGHD